MFAVSLCTKAIRVRVTNHCSKWRNVWLLVHLLPAPRAWSSHLLSHCVQKIWSNLCTKVCVKHLTGLIVDERVTHGTRSSHPQQNHICKTPRSWGGKHGAPCVNCRQDVCSGLILLNTDKNLTGLSQELGRECWLGDCVCSFWPPGHGMRALSCRTDPRLSQGSCTGQVAKHSKHSGDFSLLKIIFKWNLRGLGEAKPTEANQYYIHIHVH